MINLFKLQNGLRVVVESTDYVNSVSVGLWVENGSRNENSINNGISHFIEHMLFKGTTNRTSKELAESIEDVGGQINAFTGKEATCFYIKALNSHFQLGLEILSDMLFNSKFSEEDIEKEKSVVVEEINMSEDSPEDVLIDLHSKAIWGKDPISMPILGSEETVNSFTRSQLVDYVKSYYIPENSVISISGNVSMSEAERLVGRYFGGWNTPNKKITNYSKPKLLSSHLYKEKSIEQLHINLGVPGLETGNEDLYPLLVLNNTLGGGASSILFQKIREEYGMCYSIYSYLSTFNNTGTVCIYTGLNPSCASEAVSLIKEELFKFVKQGISDEKLRKSKEQLKGSYILGLESTSSRMFSNGKNILFLGKINTQNDIIEKIDKINQDRLHEVMYNTFSKGILNSAFVGESGDIASLNNILESDIIAFKNQKSKLV